MFGNFEEQFKRVFGDNGSKKDEPVKEPEENK